IEKADLVGARRQIDDAQLVQGWWWLEEALPACNFGSRRSAQEHGRYRGTQHGSAGRHQTPPMRNKLFKWRGVPSDTKGKTSRKKPSRIVHLPERENYWSVRLAWASAEAHTMCRSRHSWAAGSRARPKCCTQPDMARRLNTIKALAVARVAVASDTCIG